jgi:hypothetical protein
MKTVYVLLLWAVLISLATAQTGVPLIGTTEDQSGAVIPNENLTLINKVTGEVRKTMSDGDGQFRFSDVQPGDYLLRGEAEGFTPTEVSLSVHNKPMAAVKVGMGISAAEEVTVSAAATQPDAPENNASAVYVNSEMISALPAPGQDVLPVLNNFLSPAARGAGGASIVVDGVEGGDLNLPSDSLKRIYINKNPYSAEFRRPGSARVEVVTRNGSRGHFDGSVAYFARNDVFDARNAFANEKPDLDRRLFEANLGGPLPIKRARFFLSGSRLTSDESAVVNAETLSGPFIQNIPTSQHTTNLLGRIDLRPNDANTVTVLYSFHDEPQNNRGVGGLRLPEQGTSADDRRHKLQMSDTTVLSPSLLNVARFTFERRKERVGIRATAPEIEVRGAFIGGPNQSARSNQETKLEFQDIASYTRGKHTLRFGGAFRQRSFTFNDATNFGGSFTFSDLSTFGTGDPTLFQIIQGTSEGSFSLPEAYGFFQDEIKLAPDATLMLGLRYDWQAKTKDHNNLAPRLALAWAPGDRKTVLRLGGGIFYDRLPNEAVEQSVLLDGAHAQEFIIDHPSFPNPSTSGIPSSVWRLAPKLQSPYLIQGSLGLERKLWGTTTGAIEYQYLRGVHFYRARDINAPADNGVPRPDPNFLLVRQIESTASLRSNALLATFQGRLARAVKIKAQYTFSHTSDDTDGPLALPASSFDLRSEWGRSSFDRRHRFVLAGTFDLPWNLRLGEMFTVTSGAPFNITTGLDNNGDGIANDRPARITRNTGDGPGFAQLDLRLTKVLRFVPIAKEGDYRNLELSVDVFNVFNHPNFTNVIGDISSSRFGIAHTALAARTIQLSVKFNFRANREREP